MRSEVIDCANEAMVASRLLRRCSSPCTARITGTKTISRRIEGLVSGSSARTALGPPKANDNVSTATARAPERLTKTDLIFMLYSNDTEPPEPAMSPSRTLGRQELPCHGSQMSYRRQEVGLPQEL